jgi:hypothetical protein
LVIGRGNGTCSTIVNPKKNSYTTTASPSLLITSSKAHTTSYVALPSQPETNNVSNRIAKSATSLPTFDHHYVKMRICQQNDEIMKSQVIVKPYNNNSNNNNNTNPQQ